MPCIRGQITYTEFLFACPREQPVPDDFQFSRRAVCTRVFSKV